MHEYSVLTMWGPPGTGKTQVLNAIISMAFRSNQTVHICAPSNAAIDEILTRINAKGLLCLSHFRGAVTKEFAYEPTAFNLEAPSFTEENFEPDNAVQLRDIILRLGAEEY